MHPATRDRKPLPVLMHPATRDRKPLPVLMHPATMNKNKKMCNIKKDKNGQGWGLDIIIAGVIFMAGIITLYIYAINYSSQSQKHLDELFYEGNVAVEQILSEGDAGILTEGRVNQSKLDFFQANYNAEKTIIGVTRNFYFVMENLEINGLPASYVGMVNSSNTENLIQVTGITIYKNKPSRFDFYIWE